MALRRSIEPALSQQHYDDTLNYIEDVISFVPDGGTGLTERKQGGHISSVPLDPR